MHKELAESAIEPAETSGQEAQNRERHFVSSLEDFYSPPKEQRGMRAGIPLCSLLYFV
jgi:hypothetical protein